MINILRSEWIKLRTVRINWVLLLIAAAFPLIVCLLTVSLQNEDDLYTSNVLELVNGTCLLTALLIGVIGAVSVTSEFGFGTIRPTFAANPRRFTVLIGKAIVTTVFAAVAVAAIAGVTLMLSLSIASSRALESTSLDQEPQWSAAFLGLVLFGAILALLGYGLGLLTRSTPAAVAILVLWPLLVEGLLTGLLTVAGVDRALRYMPYQNGFRMADPSRFTDDDLLSRAPAGLYFFAVTLAIVVLGAVLVERRDA